MKLTPYFEVNGNRYEFKRTHWLIAEHSRLGEEMPLSAEDKANAVRANNLVADAKKFADKAEEMWEELCKNPTPENRATYSMFKEMSDDAIEKYNDFIAKNDTVKTTFKRNIDILEIVAIKALAEQYFNFNESLAKQTWEAFVDSMESHDDVAEWLTAMAECLFGKDEDEEDTGFLAQKRKMDEEKANNRKSALRRKR
jgi:benzoyl-CoA reductase/2-hydroxyglutaryl-CoA dehydratase subunit BcrC/BadD/HgdB